MAEKEKHSGNIFDGQVLRRLMRYVKPYKWRFLFVFLLTVSLGLLAPIRPFLVQSAIDDHILMGDYQGLVNIILILLGILVFQAIIQYTHTYLSGWLGQYIIRDLRVLVYKHLMKLRLRFYDRTPIGRLVTRTVSDLETLSDVFSQGVASIIADILQVIFIVVAMLILDWKLALVSLATFPLLLLATYVFKEKVKFAFNEVRNAVSNLNSFVQEHITGMSIVQVFNTEKREYEDFKKINKEHRKAHVRSVMYYSIYFPVAEIIQASALGLVVWFGGRLMLGDTSDTAAVGVGTITSFIMLINMFFRPIRAIADRFNTLQMGIVSSDRIFKLLDNDEHIADEGNHQPEHIEGRVEFSKVWFAYKGEDWVLRDIDFSVEKGETVALVGATGAGKSSIINLLSRFYEINKGEITVDGRSVKDYPLSYLRTHIGVVLQDVFLFSDSILANITLGNPDISLQQAKDAAEQVGALKFIERLPGGFAYNVQERGATLSVGQRQLIAFVRAMLYQPSVIVLDEATSSVDTETEELIQQAISRIMKGRTAIVIAHRLSTIQNADKILVLEKGKIVEEGKHEELLAKKGYYEQLHSMQYKQIAQG